MKVSGRAAVAAGISFAADIQDLFIIDACGNRDLQRLFTAYLAFAIAGLTGGIDHFSRAMAAVTGLGGLHHAEGRALADTHLACAVTVGAGFGRGSRRRAGTVTVLTVFDLLIGNGFRTALCRFFKGNSHIGLHIASPARSVGIGPAGASAEAAPKEAIENIREIKTALEGARASGSAAEIGVYARMAELVVSGALVTVGQHLIGLVGLLEFDLCLLIPRVQIRVIFFCEGSVRFLDLILRGAFLDSQHLIIIPFFRQALSSLFSGKAVQNRADSPKTQGRFKPLRLDLVFLLEYASEAVLVYVLIIGIVHIPIGAAAAIG